MSLKPISPPVITRPPSLRVGLGAARAVDAGLPLLGGAAVEALFPAAVPCGRSGRFTLFADGDWLLGHASAAAGEALEAEARELYAELARAIGDHRIARVWNYVPGINELRADGLEQYRAFCRGRAAALEAAWGPEFKRRIPAASAVGSSAPELTVVVAATRRPVRHVENPAQIPAYEYPAEHGPRSPSFARATVVGEPPRDVFISGTAAIRGHATVAPGDTARQLACTVENLRLISRASGLGDDLAANLASRRHFKVYVRNACDHASVAAGLDAQLFRPADQVSYVRADICRADLNLEIEATLFGV